MPIRDPRFTPLHLVQQLEGELYNALLSVGPQIAQAVAGAAIDTANSVVLMGEALQTEYRNVRRSLTTINAQLADGAQAAIVARYDEIHAQRAHSSPYRRDDYIDPKNRRYAGGMLRDALEDRTLIRSTFDGIALVNTEMLDERAKQWHRLNFGALPSAGTSHQEFSVRWGDMTVATFGFEGEGPSAPFSLPEGVWTEGGAFYPSSEAENAEDVVRLQPRQATQGIEAWNFLDAGIEFLAENIGPAYEKLYSDWFTLANDKARGPLSRSHRALVEPNFGPGVITRRAYREDLPRYE